ncbi:hypothetical protein HAX54_037160, partial [Datura stramonium]|nr:hypothetical protein [Datura stramonium]
ERAIAFRISAKGMGFSSFLFTLYILDYTEGNHRVQVTFRINWVLGLYDNTNFPKRVLERLICSSVLLLLNTLLLISWIDWKMAGGGDHSHGETSGLRYGDERPISPRIEVATLVSPSP